MIITLVFPVCQNSGIHSILHRSRFRMLLLLQGLIRLTYKFPLKPWANLKKKAQLEHFL